MHRALGYIAVLVLLAAAVQSESNGNDYVVYVADRSLKTLTMFSAPITNNSSCILEPLELSHHDVPAVLCGAHIIKPDLLLTSIRCSPSKAGDVDVYAFPASMTQDLPLRVSEARLMQGAVSNVTFSKNYKLADGRWINNAALVQLNASIFGTQSLFSSDDEATTKRSTEFLPPVDDLVTAIDCATVSSSSVADDETRGTMKVQCLTTILMASTTDQVTSEDSPSESPPSPATASYNQEMMSDSSVETTVPVNLTNNVETTVPVNLTTNVETTVLVNLTTNVETTVPVNLTTNVETTVPVSTLRVETSETTVPVSTLRVETTVPVSTLRVETTVPVSTLRVETTVPVSTLRVETTVPVSTLMVETTVPVSTLRVETTVPVSTLSVETTVPVSTPRVETTVPVSTLRVETTVPVSTLRVETTVPVSTLTRVETTVPVSTLRVEATVPVSTLLP